MRRILLKSRLPPLEDFERQVRLVDLAHRAYIFTHNGHMQTLRPFPDVVRRLRVASVPRGESQSEWQFFGRASGRHCLRHIIGLIAA